MAMLVGTTSWPSMPVRHSAAAAPALL